MRLRITKIDEYQLLTCMKHRLWGSKSARFRTWHVGDLLAVIVDKSLAALAEVSGRAFESKERVWDNGLFPHRIPLKFVHVLQPPRVFATRSITLASGSSSTSLQATRNLASLDECRSTLSRKGRSTVTFQ